MPKMNIDENLLGQWHSDLRHSKTTAELGDVQLDFASDGKLKYVIVKGDVDQVIELTWHTHENTIITNQPSRPQIQVSPYLILPNGSLDIKFGSDTYHFVRQRTSGE